MPFENNSSDFEIHNYNLYISEFMNHASYWHDIAHEPLEFEGFDINTWRNEAEACEQLATDICHQLFSLSSGSIKSQVVIAGNYSAGKSSIINSLLGKEACPVRNEPTTSSITEFSYSYKEEIWMTKVSEGQSECVRIDKDTYNTLVKDQLKDSCTKYDFRYYYPLETLINSTIIDTPGFENSTNQGDTELTLKTINEKADVLLWVCDINQGAFTNTETKFMREILSRKQNLPIYIILNKADTKSDSAIEKILYNIKNELVNIKNIIPYSAKAVNEWNKNDLIDTVAQKTIEHLKNFLSNGLESTTMEIVCKSTGSDSYARLFVEIDGKLISFDANTILFNNSKDKLLEIFSEIAAKKKQISLNKLSNTIKKYLSQGERTSKILTDLINNSTLRKNFSYEKLKFYNEFDNFFTSSHYQTISIVKKRFNTQKSGVLFKEYFLYCDIKSLHHDLQSFFTKHYFAPHVINFLNNKITFFKKNYLINSQLSDIDYSKKIKDTICEIVDKHALSEQKCSSEDHLNFTIVSVSKNISEELNKTINNRAFFKPIFENWFEDLEHQLEGQETALYGLSTSIISKISKWQSMCKKTKLSIDFLL